MVGNKTCAKSLSNIIFHDSTGKEERGGGGERGREEGDKQLFIEITNCYLNCQQLQTEEYIDLIVTTLAEFPGLGNIQMSF